MQQQLVLQQQRPCLPLTCAQQQGVPQHSRQVHMLYAPQLEGPSLALHQLHSSSRQQRQRHLPNWRHSSRRSSRRKMA
jgi:hypothetical protein